MVTILEKSDAAEGFEQIINFLSGSYINHALTVNPHVYISCIKQFWNTAMVKRSSDVTRLQALVDKKRIVITEEVVREILQLNDAEGVIYLPNEEIFAGLARMGYEKPSTKLTFYKAFFSTQWKFFIHTILHSLSAKRTSWNEVGKGFSGVETPLFETMLRDVAEDEEAQVPAQGDDVQDPAAEEVATNVIPPTPTSPSPSSPVIPSSPPHQPPWLKVGTSQRVESSDDVENVFNQGRIIVDMDQDEGIELVADQEKDAEKDTEVKGRHADKQAEIYNIDLDHSSKVLSMQKDDTEVQEAVEVVNTAKLMTEVVTAAATQVAATSTPIPAAKPKTLTITTAPAVSTRRRKGVVIRDPEEELSSDTPAETPKVKDKGKGITREEMEAEDKEIIKSINETPTQKAAKRRKLHKQAKEDEDLKKQLEVVVDEDDDVFIEATPIGRKVPVVDYEIVMINNKPRPCLRRQMDKMLYGEINRSNIDAARLKLKLFKNITAAEEMSK
nr:hypothetical protein [Tanacetum cinerariifolium]